MKGSNHVEKNPTRVCFRFGRLDVQLADIQGQAAQARACGPVCGFLVATQRLGSPISAGLIFSRISGHPDIRVSEAELGVSR